MKRKIVIGAVCGLSLLLMSLFLTSKISDGYATAIATVFSDEAIEQEYGVHQRSLLIGSSFKLHAQSSCASLLFVLIGEKGPGIVEVSLSRKKLRDRWTVLEVMSGYFSESKVICAPMD